MCNCLNILKLNFEREIAIKYNVFDGVLAEWSGLIKVTWRNKQQRLRAQLQPTLSLTATFTETKKHNAQPFKRQTVKVIPIKPIHCCQCGEKL